LPGGGRGRSQEPALFLAENGLLRREISRIPLAWTHRPRGPRATLVLRRAEWTAAGSWFAEGDTVRPSSADARDLRTVPNRLPDRSRARTPVRAHSTGPLPSPYRRPETRRADRRIRRWGVDVPGAAPGGAYCRLARRVLDRRSPCSLLHAAVAVAHACRVGIDCLADG